MSTQLYLDPIINPSYVAQPPPQSIAAGPPTTLTTCDKCQSPLYPASSNSAPPAYDPTNQQSSKPEHENSESNASPLSDPERELLEEKKENDAKRQARGTGILALLCLLLFIHSVVMAVKWFEARTREDDLKLQLQQAQALTGTLPPDELEEVDVDVNVGALATATRVRMVTETSLMWLGPTDANGAALPPPYVR